MKEIFYKFLKDNGVSPVLYLRRRIEEMRRDRVFDRNIPTNFYISGAFSWRNTEEGEDFWCYLSLKWRTLHESFSNRQNFLI